MSALLSILCEDKFTVLFAKMLLSNELHDRKEIPCDQLMTLVGDRKLLQRFNGI